MRALGLFLRDRSPSLLGVATLACYLRAFLACPAGPPHGRSGRAPSRSPPGVAWGVDLAVGLGWLARFEPPGPGETTLVWYGVLVVAMRATAVGLALVLVFVLLDRRPGLSRPAAQAGLAGAAVLVLAWSMTIQVATSWLVPHLPRPWCPGFSSLSCVHGERRCGGRCHHRAGPQHAARARTWWPPCCCGCRMSPPDVPEPGR